MRTRVFFMLGAAFLLTSELGVGRSSSQPFSNELQPPARGSSSPAGWRDLLPDAAAAAPGPIRNSKKDHPFLVPGAVAADGAPETAADADRMLINEQLFAMLQKQWRQLQQDQQQDGGGGGSNSKHSNSESYCQVLCKTLRVTGEFGGCKCNFFDLFSRFRGIREAY